MKKYYWEICCYRKCWENPDRKLDFAFLDTVFVTVSALSEKEAITKAKMLVKRKGYRLHRVWEGLSDYQPSERVARA